MTARREGSTIATSVYTGKTGNYYFPPLQAGQYRVWAQALSFDRQAGTVELSSVRRHDFRLVPITDAETRYRQLPGEMMVAALPEATLDDARMKKIFMNNCTGCHSSSYAQLISRRTSLAPCVKNASPINRWRPLLAAYP